MKSKSTRELRVQTAPQKFEIRQNPDGTRTISGYAATFNDLSQDLGGFREKIAPGAFAQSLKDNPDILCLYGHDPNALLGRVASGTLQITEDDRGLRFTCQLPDTSTARDLTALMERGDLSAMSFGFSAIEDDWQPQPDGSLIRTLQQVTLYEISVVPQPAYTATSVNVRSCPAELRSRLTADGDDTEDDEDESSDGCQCDCEACRAGKCDECSNPDCDDPVCLENGCPMQDDKRRDRLRLSQHFASMIRNNR